MEQETRDGGDQILGLFGDRFYEDDYEIVGFGWAQDYQELSLGLFGIGRRGTGLVE